MANVEKTTSLAIRQEQPSALSLLGKAAKGFARTYAGVPIALVAQTFGQTVKIDWIPGLRGLASPDGGCILPKTRRGAVREVCAPSQAWRKRVQRVINDPGPHRKLEGLTVFRAINGDKRVPLYNQMAVVRPKVSTVLAGDIVGPEVVERVNERLYGEWMTNSEGLTVLEATEGVRLEEKIMRHASDSRLDQLGFRELEMELGRIWGCGCNEMWAKCVVDPYVKAIKRMEIEHIKGASVPILNMSGKSVVRAGMGGKLANFLRLGMVMAGGFHVSMYRGQVWATVGREPQSLSTMSVFDCDARHIPDALEVTLPFSKEAKLATGCRDGPLIRRVRWFKGHKLRIIPKIKCWPPKMSFLKERQKPLEVLPVATLYLGSQTQAVSTAMRVGVLDGPGVYDDIKKTMRVFGDLVEADMANKAGVSLGGGGIPIPVERTLAEQLGVDLGKPLTWVVDQLKQLFLNPSLPVEQMIPRPAKVLEASPSAIKIWNNGPDLYRLLTRVQRRRPVSVMEATRGLEMLRSQEFGEPIFEKMIVRHVGDVEAARKEFLDLLQVLTSWSG